MARAKVIFLEGDWLGANRFMAGLGVRIEGARHAVGRHLAETGARRVKNNLYAQNYPHAPLSTVTIERKEQAAQDPRILIADREYVEAIEAVFLGQGRWGIGVKDEKNAQKGLTHEFGGMTPQGKVVPARPHFGVEAARLFQNERAPIKEIFARIVAKRAAGGIG